MDLSALCVVFVEEDVDHLMILCPINCEVWRIFSQIVLVSFNLSTVIQMWQFLKSSNATFGYRPRAQILCLLPHAVCCSIWREWNNIIFQEVPFVLRIFVFELFLFSFIGVGISLVCPIVVDGEPCIRPLNSFMCNFWFLRWGTSPYLALTVVLCFF